MPTIKKVMHMGTEYCLDASGCKTGYVDVLIIGGGGDTTTSCLSTGGAGGFVQCPHMPIHCTEYGVVVANVSADSSFNGITAYHGGCVCGGCGASGAGPYNYNYGEHCDGKAIYGDQGCDGSTGGASRCMCGCVGVGRYGGSGGAGAKGTSGYCMCIDGNVMHVYGGDGGNGKQSDYDGTMRWYSGGRAAYPNAFTTSRCGYSVSIHPGKNGCGWNWCGGGGGNACCTVRAKPGIVVIRYHTDGSDGICAECSTGGCKYTCGAYTIHCFINCTLTEKFFPVYK